MTTIEREVQRLSAANLVTFYELDATELGGGIYHFTKRMNSDAPVTFGGVDYFPLDIEASGFTWDGKGAFPTPTLRVSNVGGIMSAAILQYRDLIGATLTRIRTMDIFLDGMPDADTGQTMPIDVFNVEQKTLMNKVFVEWRLSSVVDATGAKLPGRRVLRDVCTRKYRQYVGGAFVYRDPSDGGCPYSGTKYFDENDKQVFNPAKDVASKTLTCCHNRFGKFKDLPTYAFPGVSRLNVSSG